MNDPDPLERLKARRVEVLQTMPKFMQGMVGSPAGDHLNALRSELAQIDAALVQADNTAAIQADAASRDREAFAREAETRQQASDEAARREFEEREAERERDDRDNYRFWNRRFQNYLAIGHGGGFLGVTSGLLQSNAMVAAAGLAFWPLAFFAGGLVAAGLVPALYAEARREGRSEHRNLRLGAEFLMWLSAALFPCGAVAGLVGIFALGHPTAPYHPKPVQSVAVQSPQAAKTSLLPTSQPKSPAVAFRPGPAH